MLILKFEMAFVTIVCGKFNQSQAIFALENFLSDCHTMARFIRADAVINWVILPMNVKTKFATIVMTLVMNIKIAKKTFSVVYANVFHILHVPVLSHGSKHLRVLHALQIPLEMIQSLMLILLPIKTLMFFNSTLLSTMMTTNSLRLSFLMQPALMSS